MGWSELLRVALEALRAHKLRSFLTTLGILISVWTIVTVVSVISGMNDFVMSQVFSLSPDVFYVARIMARDRDEFFEQLRRKPITERDVERLEELCESCAEIGQQLSTSQDVRYGNRVIKRMPVFGTSASFASLQGLDLESGRYFTPSEEARRAPVAVLGARVVEELFPHLDPLGRRLTIAGLPHTVIGVQAKQGSVLGQDRDLLVFTPVGAAERYVGRNRSGHAELTLLVRARGGVDGVGRAQDEVVQVFRWLRGTPLSDPDPIGLLTAEQMQTIWRSISFTTFAVVTLIAIVSLVVGAIVVANIMLVSVIERTREIGLRLALGARKADVRRQFLVEAFLLASAGGVLGSAAGAISALLVDSLSPFPAAVNKGAMLVAILVAGSAGLIAGFMPARRAANLPPIEALRHE